MPHKRPRGWIYKCSLRNPNPGQRASWVDPDYQNWLHRNDDEPTNWGGERWIQSPMSWRYLALAKKSDLVFCHQIDKKGLVGLTLAASGGLHDAFGARRDSCSTILLGPQKVPFDKTVTVRMIRDIMGEVEMEAYAKGTKQHTFHPVEDGLLVPLVRLCCRVNPRQRKAIMALYLKRCSIQKVCVTTTKE